MRSTVTNKYPHIVELIVPSKQHILNIKNELYATYNFSINDLYKTYETFINKLSKHPK